MLEQLYTTWEKCIQYIPVDLHVIWRSLWKACLWKIIIRNALSAFLSFTILPSSWYESRLNLKVTQLEMDGMKKFENGENRRSDFDLLIIIYLLGNHRVCL